MLDAMLKPPERSEPDAPSAHSEDDEESIEVALASAQLARVSVTLEDSIEASPAAAQASSAPPAEGAGAARSSGVSDAVAMPTGSEHDVEGVQHGMDQVEGENASVEEAVRAGEVHAEGDVEDGTPEEAQASEEERVTMEGVECTVVHLECAIEPTAEGSYKIGAPSSASSRAYGCVHVQLRSTRACSPASSSTAGPGTHHEPAFVGAPDGSPPRSRMRRWASGSSVHPHPDPNAAPSPSSGLGSDPADMPPDSGLRPTLRDAPELSMGTLSRLGVPRMFQTRSNLRMANECHSWWVRNVASLEIGF